MELNSKEVDRIVEVKKNGIIAFAKGTIKAFHKLNGKFYDVCRIDKRLRDEHIVIDIAPDNTHFEHNDIGSFIRVQVTDDNVGAYYNGKSIGVCIGNRAVDIFANKVAIYDSGNDEKIEYSYDDLSLAQLVFIKDSVLPLCEVAYRRIETIVDDYKVLAFGILATM